MSSKNKKEIINEFNLKNFPEEITSDGLNIYGETSYENQIAILSHYLHNKKGRYNKKQKDFIISAIRDFLDRKQSKENLSIDDYSDENLWKVAETPEQYSFFNDFFNVPFPAPKNPKFTFIDLFAGIGGFRIAMQNLGGKCVYSSEWDAQAQKTYLANYGEMPFGDITKESTKQFIPKRFDVLCAGFPCQAFSIAGYRKGFEDTRGTLFFDVAEILKKHKPKVAFLENVKNLTTHDGGKTFAVIKGTLEDLGYRVFFKVLNAMEYANIPQNRERIIIVAFDPEQVPNCDKFVFPNPINLTKNIHDCIEPGKKAEKYYYRENQIYYTKLVEGMKSKDTIYQWRRVYVRENKNNVCPTLTANMGAGGHNVPLILTKYGIRKLTPKECLNFMGYPEEFKFSNLIAESKMYMQAGNSVVVPLMKRVAEQIVKIMNLN